MTTEAARALFKMALDMYIDDRCSVSETPEAERERDEALAVFDALVDAVGQEGHL